MQFTYAKIWFSLDAYINYREEAAEKAKKAKNRKIKRYALIGLATVGGGALIGKIHVFGFVYKCYKCKLSRAFEFEKWTFLIITLLSTLTIE